MEAGARTGLSGADTAGRDTGAQDMPWFEPFRPWMMRSDPRASGRIDLDLLNRFAEVRGLRTEDGLPLRFADARTAPPGAYERRSTAHLSVRQRSPLRKSFSFSRRHCLHCAEVSLATNRPS